MSDPAAFRQQDIQNIWGERPLCPLTGHWQFVDLQHIMGRGHNYGSGIKQGKDQRKMFSSVFNCTPLIRDVHAGGYRDHRLMRELFLEITFEKVMEKVNRGEYKLKQLDKDFLEFIDSQKHL